MTRIRLGLATVGAVAVLALWVTSASARRLEASNQSFRAIWTLLAVVVEGVARISCPVTVEGSFHSKTISKVLGSLMGYVTRVLVRGERAGCLNTGTVTVLSETLPWHLTYEGFAGTLPTITSVAISLAGASYRVHPEGSIECLARTEAMHPAHGDVQTTSGNVARTLRADETTKIPVGGSFLCEISAAESYFEGTAEVFVQGSTSMRITIRLVQ